MSDQIGDFLTIIRNGIRASKRLVNAPSSRMRVAIAKVLKEEGFIRDYEVGADVKPQARIIVHLKYMNGESAVHEIKRVSTPGLRRYSSIKNIAPVISGLGISILSTSSGVITDKQAKKLSVGGEVICKVW